ncbi:putative ferric-chelate reductase 1 [Protopterus annectens]|uniref:putative ferric-chelate reductase 1 n=1 Tax=Protopterus annectens TaxID=7888 RepID=UPI001CFB08B1|nr:putative ferric-chelate reductase 1 [Protopterus annectens]
MLVFCSGVCFQLIIKELSATKQVYFSKNSAASEKLEMHTIVPWTCFLLACCPLYAHGYGNGQVQPACVTMTPQHGVTEQTGPSPYSITADQSTYTPGAKVKVTLSGSTNNTFEGFLLQARATNNASNPHGSFQVSNNDSQTLTCGDLANSAVSHTSDIKKSNVEVTWIAPNQKDDDIQFCATIAKNGRTYWVKLPGPQLTYNTANSNVFAYLAV